MAYDIGPKIGVDGESEFRRQLQQVNTSIKTLGSEMKAVTSAFIGQEDSIEALSAQNEVLTKTIDAQKDKLQQQQKILELSKEKYGDNAEETQKWQRAVNESTAELNKLEAQLKSNNEQIDNFGNETNNSAAEMENLEQQMRTLRSQLNLLDIEYADGGDSSEKFAQKAEILSEAVEAQKKKLDKLEEALSDARNEFGDTATKTLKFEQAVNDATAELKKLERELEDAENGIEDLGDASGGAKFSFDDLSETLKTGFKAGAVIAVVEGAKEISEALLNLVRDTQEYRTIMASLETSSAAAGYTAEETTATFRQLQGVLGDTQSAATATANLQAIGLEQSKLTELTNIAIGAWAMYGDSIPIDGLAEAINETIKTGEVTGVLADVVNWAGESEETFNEKLASANSSAERANILLEQLAKQGLADAGNAWQSNHKDITAVNEAQAEFDQALADLGEALAPVGAAIISFGADALSGLAGWANKAVTAVGNLYDRLVQLGDWITGNGTVTGWGPGPVYTPKFTPHATGLNYVPYDGYLAELHKGEMVLTARQAEMMRSTGVTQGSVQSVAAAMVNGIQSIAAPAYDQPAVINLVTPEGDVLAAWQLPSLIRVANASGTPIVNPM